MPTTFDLFFLGNNGAFIDTVEGNQTAENASAFNNTTWGSASDPLALEVNSLTPSATQGAGSDGEAVSYAADNNLANEQFFINGNGPFTHDASMLYTGSVIRYTDGTVATNVQLIVMQDTAGNLYLLPPTSGPNAYSDALEAKPIESVTFGTAAPANGSDVYNMNADRYDLDLPDYVVEGTAGADVIDASYTGDPEGDLVENSDNLAGNNDDSITAGAGDDVVYAGSGDDNVAGDDGNDVLLGEGGNDTLDGSAGDDLLVGGAGADDLIGGPGLDTADYADSDAGVVVDLSSGNLVGSGGDAEGDTGSGIDGIIGSGFDDTLTGFDGEVLLGGPDDYTNIIDGGAGNDVIDGLDGSDSLYGGVGDDTIFGGGGDDLIEGDGMADTFDPRAHASGPNGAATSFDFTNDSNETVQLYWIDQNGDLQPYQTVAPGQTVTQTTFENHNWAVYDTATGQPLQYLGNPANGSTVVYAQGNDSIDAGAGDDTIVAGGGDDIVSGGDGNDSIDGGSGNDILDGGAGTDTLDGGAGNDTLTSDGANDSLIGGDGADTFIGTGISPTGVGNFNVDGGSGGDDNDTLDLSAYGADGFVVSGLTQNPENNGNPGFSGEVRLTNPTTGESLVINYTDIENLILPADGVVDGTAGDDTMAVGYTDTQGDQIDGTDGLDDTIFAGAGSDSVYGGLGNDLVYGGDDDDYLAGQEGNDTIFGEDGNDVLAGGAGDDVIGGFSSEAGNDIIFGDAGNDDLNGGNGDDTLYGGDDNDTLTGASGNDTAFGGQGSDTFNVTDDHETIVITGGEDAGDTDTDSVSFYNFETTQGVTVTSTGDEQGTFAYNAPSTSSGITSSGSYSQIEEMSGTFWDDTFDLGSDNSGVSVDANEGDDVITTGSGADVIEAGSGADTVNAGAGDDVIGLAANTGPDGDQDVIILQDGFGNDTISAFDAPTPNGDGTFTGIDTFDVTALTDGTRQVYAGDVVVTDDGSGNALLTMPNGESVTLFGIDPATADNPFWLNAVGFPLSDGTVEGTSGADTIGASYTGDPDGDMVDAGDAVLPGTTNNDDVIYAYGGDDIANAGDGNDTVYGGDGNDTIDGGTGDDSVFGEAGNDTISGGDGNDYLDGDAGTDIIDGDAGNDTIVGDDGNDDLFGGTGDDAIFASSGDNFADGGDGNDQVFMGTGDDLILGGTGNDVLSGGGGDDTIILADTFGNDTISGGETGETAGDTLDASAITTDLTIDLSNANPETGSVSDGTFTANFTEIENIILGGGRDTVVLADGSGNDAVAGFDLTDSGDGTTNDQLDVSGLTDADGYPVNVVDVEVTDTNGDGTGDAILNFPNGETFTLAGISPAAVSDPAVLVAMGIPPVGPVDGTAGDDTMAIGYTDTQGDQIDGTDGLDDTILAGAGNDSVFGGLGNDLVYGGDDDDYLAGQEGNDTIFGEDGNDQLRGNVGDDVLYGGAGKDSLAGGIGADTIFGGLGDDSLVGGVSMSGGEGNDTIEVSGADATVTGDDGDDLIRLLNNPGTTTVVGGETGETDGDTLDLSAVSNALVVDLSAADPESGTVADGAEVLTFSEIENIILGGGADTVVLADGSGSDAVSGFDMTDSGDGTTIDQLDVSGLTDANGAIVNTGDVVVTDTNGDGTGDAILTFPNGENITLIGVSPAQLATPAQLASIGIPEPDYTVSGTAGDDLIDAAYTGDPEGDMVDAGDAADGSDNDVIDAGAGNDTVLAALGDDTLYGGEGNDSLFGNEGNDTLFGGDGDDYIEGHEGADSLSGGAGNDTVIFSEGDTADGGTGDDLFILDDLGEPTNGTITIDGGSEDGADTLQLGTLGVLTQEVRDSFVDDGTGSFSGSVTLDDGTILNFSEIENIICFTPGTRIATPHGLVAIEDLEVGDLVVTRDHGLQPIRWIEGRTVPALDRFAPVRIRPNVLSGQDRDLIVSPQHRVLFQGYRAELLFGESEVLVAARHLIDGMDVTQLEGETVTYVHMLFDQHEIIYAEGAATESFHPGDIGFSAVGDAAREELFAIFPKLRADPKHYGSTARRCLKAHEAKLIRS